ncbi:thioesterase II family protein [Streptomyces sp. AK02-01A]|uniref:thioesterase II family protein n=1 Tax=Streptomyces sp. AK02-01A TaxID=3028648 RepID=UPI0029B53CDF|nr:alpha/beta fold hydrolase [Streptomyces sp. AK02-01A]MDX3853678.1 alpha/beta fold hydrolase [Streptomyces sp. AK02-01A]
MDSKWFRRYGRTDPGDSARPRLICFPHAGGAASAYAGLARLLPPHLDVVAVQYPGRQDRRRETPAAGITALAGSIAERLREETAGPYAFFGHSMGALVAYETARALQRWDAPGPVRLLLSGRGVPSAAPNPHDQLDSDRAVLAAVRRLGGTDAAVLDDPELVAMALPALRADYGALASYRWTPDPVLNTPVSVFVGADDPVVPVAAADAWRERTALESETLVFPGGHFYLGGQLDKVAEAIVDRLGVRAWDVSDT